MTGTTRNLRKPEADDCQTLTALCLRSKAHWGYDAQFMELCADELRVTPALVEERFTRLAEQDGRLVGYVELSPGGQCAELEKLFVDPPAMGQGVGAQLMGFALDYARKAGCSAMIIDADPEAVGFYRKFGAVEIGRAVSASIPGRTLPRLRIVL